MSSIDVSRLELVGEGTHGKVYRLDEKRCIKVCTLESDMQREYRVLKHAEGFPQFPRVYECKGNYMIREFVDGQNIADFIEENGLDADLAKQLIDLVDVFSKLGFTRLDCRLSQLFVTKDKQLKIIDTTAHMESIADYPYKMLQGIRKLGYTIQFLNYVKELRPDYYQAWISRDRKLLFLMSI